MEKYIDFLNSKCDTYKNCKFVSVSYYRDTNTLEIVLVYPEDFVFTQKMKDDLIALTYEYLGQKDIQIKMTIKKSYLDVDVIKRFLSKYIKEHYTALFTTFSEHWCDIDIKGKDVTIKIYTTPAYKSYLIDRKFDNEIIASLDKIFFGSFTILICDDNSIDLSTSLKMQEEIVENEVDSFVNKKKTYYNIKNVESFVGPKIEINPIAIKDLDNSIEKNVICGKILFLNKRSYKSKKKDENGNAIEKFFYSFTLKDPSGSIHCAVFPTKATEEKLATLQDDMFVAVSGDLDNYNDRQSFKVKDISTCEIEIVEEVEEEKPTKKINDKYLFVKPEPYENKGQVDIFSIDIVHKANSFLAGKDFVVYDFETTGLDTQSDTPIEIGAVKVHDGKIIETFDTFVNPMKNISFEITKLTGITNEMLRDKLPIEKILPDFMKFVDGCAIVGYNNIDFDNKMLSNICKRLGYKFPSETYDAIVLARKYLRGVKNYKLGTIAQYLSVTLDNAHRAIYDTIATAEVFIKLTDYLANDKTAKNN